MYLKNEEDIGNKERYDFHKLFHMLYFICSSLQISMRSIYLQCGFYFLLFCVVPALFCFHFHLQGLQSKNHLEGGFNLKYDFWSYQ